MGRFCFHWSYLSFSSFFSFDRGGMVTINRKLVYYVCLSDGDGMLGDVRVSPVLDLSTSYVVT